MTPTYFGIIASGLLRWAGHYTAGSWTPKAVNNWSPSACSSSLFLGHVTARIAGAPVVSTRSRMLIVLPLPGSATITCQLRLWREERSVAWKRAGYGGLDEKFRSKEGVSHD